MRISLGPQLELGIHREPGDPRFYRESTFMYHVRNALRAKGLDVISKRADRDGHMTQAYYIRDRKWRFAWWDERYQIRDISRDFNAGKAFIRIGWADDFSPVLDAFRIA